MRPLSEPVCPALSPLFAPVPAEGLHQAFFNQLTKPIRDESLSIPNTKDKNQKLTKETQTKK